MFEDTLYFGQLDPKWRENAQKIIDEQTAIMKEVEGEDRRKNLPKQIAIFGGGVLVLLTILIIIKNKK
jgi:hypothetical protein